MRSYIAVVGMAATAVAQTAGFNALTLPDNMEAVPACTTYNVQWTPTTDDSMDGLVMFSLIGGDSQTTLQTMGDSFGSVESSAGTYAWEVPCDAGTEALYGLVISLVSDSEIFQYSMPFTITPAEESTMTETADETDIYESSSTYMERPMPTGSYHGTGSYNGTGSYIPTGTMASPYTTATGAVDSIESIDSIISTAGAPRYMTAGSFAAAAVAAFFAL